MIDQAIFNRLQAKIDEDSQVKEAMLKIRCFWQMAFSDGHGRSSAISCRFLSGKVRNLRWKNSARLITDKDVQADIRNRFLLEPIQHLSPSVGWGFPDAE